MSKVVAFCTQVVTKEITEGGLKPVTIEVEGDGIELIDISSSELTISDGKGGIIHLKVTNDAFYRQKASHAQ